MNEKDFRKFAKSSGLQSSLIDDVTKYQSNEYLASVGTPHILEEREMRVTQMSVFDRLMLDRIIWISGTIESNMAAILQAQLMFLDNLDSTKDIKMHLDTPGGSVLSGLGILDVMNYVKSDIATINLGMCASMGSILLSSGTKGKRTSLLYSKVMTHQLSHGTQGNIQDTRINQMEAEKYNYILFKILAENTGKSFEDIIEISNRDRWFNSDEAIKYGLIDEIVGINDKISVSKQLEGFEDYYNTYVLKMNYK